MSTEEKLCVKELADALGVEARPSKTAKAGRHPLKWVTCGALWSAGSGDFPVLFFQHNLTL